MEAATAEAMAEARVVAVMVVVREAAVTAEAEARSLARHLEAAAAGSDPESKWLAARKANGSESR